MSDFLPFLAVTLSLFGISAAIFFHFLRFAAASCNSFAFSAFLRHFFLPPQLTFFIFSYGVSDSQLFRVTLMSFPLYLFGCFARFCVFSFSFCESLVSRQANKIVSDPTHILHPEFQLLPSGRRFRVPRSRLNRYKHSFLPMSIKLLNIHMK